MGLASAGEPPDPTNGIVSMGGIRSDDVRNFLGDTRTHRGQGCPSCVMIRINCPADDRKLAMEYR